MLLVAALARAGGPGFRTSRLLANHFTRYGTQFGAINEQRYLHLAQRLRDASPCKHIRISMRPDGGGSKFDVKRGWFVVYDGDGTLRTFFIPKDGVRYFERQQKSDTPANDHGESIEKAL
jgi:pyocin large subunit-like protein